MQEIEEQEERIRCSFPTTHRNYFGRGIREIRRDIDDGLLPVLERRRDFCDHEIAVFDVSATSEFRQGLGREF